MRYASLALRRDMLRVGCSSALSQKKYIALVLQTNPGLQIRQIPDPEQSTVDPPELHHQSSPPPEEPPPTLLNDL